MSFTVVWTSEAFDAIEELFETVGDPDEIRAAILELDRMLSVDPAVKGESRSGRRRIVFVPPMGAIFEVDWLAYQVVVVEVWGYRIGH